MKLFTTIIVVSQILTTIALFLLASVYPVLILLLIPNLLCSMCLSERIEELTEDFRELKNLLLP